MIYRVSSFREKANGDRDRAIGRRQMHPISRRRSAGHAWLKAASERDVEAGSRTKRDPAAIRYELEFRDGRIGNASSIKPVCFVTTRHVSHS